MNELRRMAYLDALGVDTYVSRRQLPGAAATRRLAIARPGATAARARVPSARPRPVATLRKTREEAAAVPAPGPEPAVSRRETGVVRFSLSAIVAGDWLWLEELHDTPLAVEQIHLVEAMARALCRTPLRPDTSPVAAGTPDVTQFDWPIHTNRQLALDEEAARAAVAGFVNRKLEQFGCAGLVLLGSSCGGRVPSSELGVRAVCTASTAEILAQPDLKPQVWRDLQPLLRAP